MIANNKIPIVVLFGPPVCGKTMTLIRLCHYLRTIGYQIRLCWGDINLNCLATAAVGSIYDNLVEVIDSKGQLKLYVYEAPGDWYMRQNQYPFSLVSLLSSFNPKIWCFYTEPHYADLLIRQKYVQTIDHIYHHFVEPSKDRNIIIHNKIDQTPFRFSPQEVNVAATLQSVENLYPGLFDIFKNTSFIQKWFKPYKFTFVPFMTGKYINDNDYCAYIPGPDIYPANLWKAIL